MVGASFDAWDLSVITAEFKRRYNEVPSEEEKTEDDDGVDMVHGDEDDNDNAKSTKKKKKDTDASGKGVSLGKHYMVFMASTWAKEGRPYSFVAARYCLESHSPGVG